MNERLKEIQAISLALAVAIGCTACGEKTSESYPNPICEATQPENWGATPSNFVAEPIAKHLDVSVEAIRGGRFGIATCDDPVIANRITKYVVSVPGQGKLCQVLGILPPDGKPPHAGTEYHDVFAVCAAEDS